MNLSHPLDGDPFAPIVALALATGLLSLEDPGLLGLVLALVTLAVATRLTRLRSAPRPRVALHAELMALSLVAIGGLLFFLPAGPFAPFRGAVLAATLLPLWTLARRRVGLAEGAAL